MTAASAWESLTGRRDVLIGASFTRAWNERIGKTTKRSKGYPNPEYYSLRYNFKPESIDNENTGTLTPKPGGDGHVFELERPSQQPGESHKFTAVEQPSKDWECVLLWDPATQQLTLEKLESTLNLTHGGRSGTRGRAPSATPPSAAGPSRGKRESTSSSQGRSAQASPLASTHELAEDLERALTSSVDADAEGEPDDELEFQTELDAAAALSMKQEEEEDEDEDEMEAVDVAAAQPPPPPPVRAKPAPKPKPKPSAKPRPRPSLKRDRDDDIEEEVLAFGEPSRQMKRPRRASASGVGLALPSAPPPPQYHAIPTPSELLQPPRITYAGSETDSDDSDDGDGALGEELDAAALELELEQTLAEEAEDEDEGMEAVPLENGHHDSGRPLSLNELFGGQSPDDTSSSDDSDDD